MTSTEIKERIEIMNLEGFTNEEIAEELGDDRCVQEFRECPQWCHEDADCFECWEKCIEIELNR